MIKYPYTDFHEMNLDWLLQQMKSLNERMDSFVDEITADIIPIVQHAIEEGLIDVTYDSTNETVVLVPGAGVTSQHLAKFFQINNFKYPVADQTARNTINNWISNFDYTLGSMYKNAVFIGDSYLEGWTPDGTNPSWGTLLKNKLQLDNAYIYYQGGSGFSATNNNRNFVTMLTEAHNDNAFNNSDIDLIVVGGGFNDQNFTYSDIVTRIETFATNARNYFPHARIYVVDMCWSQQTAASRSTVYQKATVSTAYYNGANDNNLIPFTTCWKSLIGVHETDNVMLSSDDVHPNSYGQESLARALHAFITGGMEVYANKSTRIPTSPISSIFAQFDGDSVSTFLTGHPRIELSNISALTGRANGSTIYIDLPEIPGFRPVTDVRNWGDALILVQDATGYYMINCTAGFHAGKIRLYPVDVENDHSNYRYLNTINYVELESLNVSVPALWA